VGHREYIAEVIHDRLVENYSGRLGILSGENYLPHLKTVQRVNKENKSYPTPLRCPPSDKRPLPEEHCSRLSFH
jgi:hypothetical protein